MVTVNVIAHADGHVFIREGDCDGCWRDGVAFAQCCTFIALPLSRRLSEDERRWVELHPGLTIEGHSVRIEVRCSALSDDGSCLLFGTTRRPAICERSPELPEQVLPGCAYKLREVPQIDVVKEGVS